MARSRPARRGSPSETAAESAPSNGASGSVEDSASPYLKIVQNRLRNLKKSIDKAAKLEASRDSGAILDEEQSRSLESKESKMMLYRELEEIFRKQSLVVEQELQQAAEKAKAEAKDRDDAVQAAVASAVAKADARADQAAADLAAANSQHELVPPSSEAAIAAAADATARDSASPSNQTRAGIWKVLSILHVIDFLNNEAGSGEQVLERLNATAGETEDVRDPKYSQEDIEGVKYFGRMLTSPNGAVPVEDAVSTSTYHAMNFVEESDSEVFAGTSYAALVTSVKAVTEVPDLKNRGLPPPRVSGGTANDLDDHTDTRPALNFFAQPEPDADCTFTKQSAPSLSSVAATEDTTVVRPPSTENDSVASRDVPEAADVPESGAVEPLPKPANQTPAVSVCHIQPPRPAGPNRQHGHVGGQPTGGRGAGGRGRGRGGSRGRGSGGRGRGGSRQTHRGGGGQDRGPASS